MCKASLRPAVSLMTAPMPKSRSRAHISGLRASFKPFGVPEFTAAEVPVAIFEVVAMAAACLGAKWGGVG